MRSTKIACILLVLVIAASALGCIGQKKDGASTKTPSSTATSIASTNGIAESDLTINESDINQLDSMISDMSMDISLSEVDI